MDDVLINFNIIKKVNKMDEVKNVVARLVTNNVTLFNEASTIQQLFEVAEAEDVQVLMTNPLLAEVYLDLIVERTATYGRVVINHFNNTPAEVAAGVNLTAIANIAKSLIKDLTPTVTMTVC